MDGYLTKREAAQYLHVHPRTINRYIKAGKLKAYRGPGITRFKKEDLDNVFK
jgi:excisionase family DNA binding protein